MLPHSILTTVGRDERGVRMTILYMCVNKKDGILVVLTWNINEAKYFEKGFNYKIVKLSESDQQFLKHAINTLGIKEE